LTPGTLFKIKTQTGTKQLAPEIGFYPTPHVDDRHIGLPVRSSVYDLLTQKTQTEHENPTIEKRILELWCKPI